MNPIQKYLTSLFARQRIMGDAPVLKRLAKADAVLTNLVNEKKVPALSITVLREGQIFLQKGYGYVDLKKKNHVNATKTIFRIASVSKPIAATALAQMVAEGLIDLDASFYDYVPYYPKKKWDFTIRQLASHTAGIRGYQGVEYGLNQPYSLKESIDIFKDDDLVFKPGNGYLYNSYDWVLVSLAMQEVSGVPFEEYVQKKVLKIVGMKNTFPECPSESNLRVGSKEHNPVSTALSLTDYLSKFHTKNQSGFRPAVPVNNCYKLAGGGYLSTSEDVAKLGQAYLEGTILKERVLSEFLTSQNVNGRPTYYGLGWQVSKDAKGRPFYGHVGSGVGGYSNFFVYPEERMVFAILINCTHPDVQTELDETIDFLLPPHNS